MRFLIVNTDYPDFLRAFHEEHPGLTERSYAEQLATRNASLFGVADFYSSNLRLLGHEAEEVHANNEALQRAWAREHDMLPERRGYLARLSRRTTGWFERVLVEQVRGARPDVLLVHDMITVGPPLVRRLKPHAGLVVGQHAATALPHRADDLGVYDVVISSFPPTVEFFSRLGVPAALHRLGFDPRVLAALDEGGKRFDVTFVGSLFPGVHDSRIELLEHLARRLENLRVYSPSLENGSPLRDHWAGPAYGRTMYQVLRDSRLTLNEHGNVAAHANNCRLYEATGVGTALVTDWKPDLDELFEPGRDVLAFRDPQECLEIVEEYLRRPDEREAIAAAGQARTLRDHTYLRRMEELVALLEPYARRRQVA